MSDEGPLKITLKEEALCNRVMRRCQSQQLLVDDATEVMWRRELAQRRPIQRASEDGRDWKVAALRLAAAWRRAIS